MRAGRWCVGGDCVVVVVVIVVMVAVICVVDGVWCGDVTVLGVCCVRGMDARACGRVGIGGLGVVVGAWWWCAVGGGWWVVGGRG